MISKNLFWITLTYLFAFNVSAEIIFESDFANDGDYFDTRTSAVRFTDLPEGFDGIRTNQGTIRGVPGAGVGGSVALKFEWPATTTPLATSLFKHLTGNKNTGYDEVYVRYRVRLPNKLKAGTGGDPLPYWKWGRLWQNTGPTSGYTENRVDSYYVVWNWGNGLPIYGIKAGILMGGNTGANRDKGSAGGPRYNADFYVSGGEAPGYHNNFPGHWDAVGNGDWEFDPNTRKLLNNTNQDWHTLEWRYKLSSSDTANDGIWQLWFDGVEQQAVKTLKFKGGADDTLDKPFHPHSLPTAAKPGFNLLTVFDNMSKWPVDWDKAGVEGGIYLNDLVVSTSRIGHNYNVGDVGDPPPNPPSSVVIQ